MEGARRATGISPGETSSPASTVTLHIVSDRIEMFLETSLPTDPNGSKVLTQHLSSGLSCMTYSLVFQALDGFTFLMSLNVEFEVPHTTLIRTMGFIPVRR